MIHPSWFLLRKLPKCPFANAHCVKFMNYCAAVSENEKKNRGTPMDFWLGICCAMICYDML